MNSIRKQLFRWYPDAIETFGYVTKANRFKLGVEKAHFYDACTIATQGKPFIVKSNLYKKKCVSDGDFQKTKWGEATQISVYLNVNNGIIEYSTPSVKSYYKLSGFWLVD